MKYLFFLLTFQAYAFTLNNNFEGAFKNPKIKVKPTSNFSCANAILTKEELINIIEEAVDYWNKIPSSSLKLIAGGEYNTSSTDFANGHLCVSGSCNLPVVPKVSGVVIACNSNAADNFSSSNILATTLPTNFTSKEIKGSVIIINDTASSKFSTLSTDERIAVIAHELGHAIGLGHSAVKESLMYFSTVPERRSVGRDDMAGATYLYPREIASCGTIGSPSDFIINFGIGVLISLLFFVLPMKRRDNKRKTTERKS